MKFAIKHEIKGRIRIHLAQKHMTYRQADILQCYLEAQTNVTRASIYVRTQDVAVSYTGSREELISLLSRFSYETAQVSETALENSGRELNETYKEKLINSVVLRTLNKMFLPYPVQCGTYYGKVYQIPLPWCPHSAEGKTGGSGTGCHSHRCFHDPR